MANYIGTARTNYVTVEDIDSLKEALGMWPLIIVTNDKGQVALLDNDHDGAGWPVWGLDDDGNEVQLDVAEVIMPFVKEGDVLVVKEVGHEKQRYVCGWANAYIRRGDDVQEVCLNLNDIYRIAAEKFGVPEGAITNAEY